MKLFIHYILLNKNSEVYINKSDLESKKETIVIKFISL